jgi:5-methylcytosine-specific restriction protein B
MASTPPIYPAMKIFHGPPGTGKTWFATKEAVRLIDGTIDDSTYKERHRQLVSQGRIIWVTFHPNYSYEDFVEGFRPVRDSEGRVAYDIVDGPVKIAAERCKHSFAIGDQLGRYTIHDLDSGGAALKSEVHRADVVVDYILQYADYWTINYLKSKGVTPPELSIPGKDNERKQHFARTTNLPTTFLNNCGHIRALWEGIESRAATTVSVVLVIDEINRADLSRVFGELITLLEWNKRSGNSEEKVVMLPYSKRPFSLPSSLSIIGTMNTADRSLAVLDYALRRRFEFVEIPPDSSLCSNKITELPIGQIFELWNDNLTALLSRDNRIGHSYFMDEHVERVIHEKGFTADTSGRVKAFAWIIRSEILPLLLEYFHDDWVKAAIVLGFDPSSSSLSLLESKDFNKLEKKIGDFYDLKEFSSFQIPNWWDPISKEWDEEKFKSAVRSAIDNI